MRGTGEWQAGGDAVRNTAAPIDAGEDVAGFSLRAAAVVEGGAVGTHRGDVD